MINLTYIFKLITMSQNQPSPKQQFYGGLLFFGTGLLIILASIDIISIDEAGLNATRWVLGLCGFVFALAGIMIYLGNKSKWNHLLAAVLVFAMGSIGGWVAFFGAGDKFSGGTSLLSADSNSSLARIMFGFGALICFLISLYGVKMHFKERKK